MRYRVAAAVAVAGIVAAGAARADSIFTNGLYTVINYSGAYPDFKKDLHYNTPSFMDGVEADVGWRFNRYYSLEASYSYFSGSNRPHGGPSTTNTLQTASIDALGYLPLGRATSWALYADVGATEFFEDVTETGVVSSPHADRFGGRAGGGVQYQFDEDLGLRVGGRYEFASLPDMKSVVVFAVGLVWQR